MKNIINRSILVFGFLMMFLISGPSSATAQESDSSVYVRLTSIDPELLQYFPRWYVCESDLQAKIFNAFRVLGYRRDRLDQQKIMVTAQPVANAEDPYEVLIVECGQERMTSQEMSANLPNILSKLSERARQYCYTDIPTTVPASQPQAEAIVSFLQPTNVNHSFLLSAFEQSLKLGKSGFWVKNVMGTDQVGYHFWNAGEAKVVLQRPLYVNDDPESRRAIPYLLNARLGFGYRLTSNPNESSVLNFIPSRKLDAGYGGKFVGALDFNMPFAPQFGLSINAELPLVPVKLTESIDTSTYVMNAIDADREGNITFDDRYDEKQVLKNTANLIRATGQVTFFYNLWLDDRKPENFFRFDAGLNYYEIRETAVMNDGTRSYLALDGIGGLNLWKPNEFADWLFLKAEYRNQSTFPFGISMQYANQSLLAHAYIPILGQWLYLEGKYNTILRDVRPFERGTMFMISPVLRLTF
ncbi:MAG: hypothetical protein FJ211_08500 [Ignavibacteria bacterium]|nr:hypothetical protein [Ignavibacteria bacterium]